MIDDAQSPTLERMLENINESAAECEFVKSAKSKLEELINIREKEGNALEEKIADFKSRWAADDERIKTIMAHLRQCYGDWTLERETICADVFKPIASLEEALQEKLGICERQKRRADSEFERASREFEAWKTITKWIGTRLDENRKLIEEVCTLDRCKDHRFALYLVHFELLPRHYQLQKIWKELGKEYVDPRAVYCASECPPEDTGDDDDKKVDFVGLPWLLDPPEGRPIKEVYGEWLQKAWKAWRTAGTNRARKAAAVDYIQTITARLNKLAEKEEKRRTAREALRALKTGEDGSPSPPSGGSSPSPITPETAL